jgi:hypothetical protein
MGDLASAIDNSPLMKLLTGIVMDGPGALLQGAGRLAAGFGEGISSLGSVFGSVKETLVGGAMSMGSSSGPEIAPAVERAQTPARVSEYEVNMADIGTFAPPSFGGQSVGGIGRG